MGEIYSIHSAKSAGKHRVSQEHSLDNTSVAEVYSLEDTTANCFTVDRVEPFSKGFTVHSEENGGGYVSFAKRCIYLNYDTPCRVAYDLYTGVSTVNQARIVREGSADGFVDTLHPVNRHEIKSALVRVLLYADCNDIPNHELFKLWTETHWPGVYVGSPAVLSGYDGLTTMVKVSAGEKFSCYFPDGFVRTFFYTGQTLKEVSMTSIEMVRMRIEIAWKELRIAEFLSGDVKTHNQGCAISKVLNLFFYLKDHDSRAVLYQDFFQVLSKISLNKELGELFEKRLRRTLYALDRQLFYSMRPLLSTTQVKSSNVVNLDDCRNLKKRAVN